MYQLQEQCFEICDKKYGRYGVGLPLTFTPGGCFGSAGLHLMTCHRQGGGGAIWGVFLGAMIHLGAFGDEARKWPFSEKFPKGNFCLGWRELQPKPNSPLAYYGQRPGMQGTHRVVNKILECIHKKCSLFVGQIAQLIFFPIWSFHIFPIKKRIFLTITPGGELPSRF